MTHGAEVPNSSGIGGGLPGRLVAQRFTLESGKETNLGPIPALSRSLLLTSSRSPGRAAEASATRSTATHRTS
ncbi:hypothetical protein ACIBF7_03625 [Nonomuraea sp. NPDC050478]|uniref:hypothetical protein n=1 Tax=Nonomuraea sp. NPDC050478 TaxID=3364365 RepID=UPI0037A4407F